MMLLYTSFGFVVFVSGLISIYLSRGVHSPVPESAGHHEAETPREGAVHKHVGPGQGGDEGTVYFLLKMTINVVQYSCIKCL